MLCCAVLCRAVLCCKGCAPLMFLACFLFLLLFTVSFPDFVFLFFLYFTVRIKDSQARR